MSALFPELAIFVLFLSSFPLMFKLRMISTIMVLAPHGEVAKTLLLVRLATHKLHVPVDDVAGLDLLTTTLAYKHMAPLLPKFKLVRRWQRLKHLFTEITGVTLSALSLHTDHIQQQPEIPLKTRPQHMQVKVPAVKHPSLCAP